MLKKLIEFSISQPGLIVILAVALVGYAAYEVPRMPVDVFPELNAPTVVVLSEAGGLAADEVEQNVTFPVETAVNGLPGVRRVRSASSLGLSIVWVEFDWGMDIYRARQLVTERLAPIGEALPEGVHTEITPITSITGEIMLLALSAPDRTVTDLDLRLYGEFDLRNRLLAIPGVAQVGVIGGELPEYQVNVRQDDLALFDLTVPDVIEAARSAHSVATAGYLSNVDRQELPLRQTARVRDIEDIRNTIVTYDDDVPLTIGDVADVVVGPAPKRGTAANQGNPAVVLTIQKSPGINTLALTESIDHALDTVEKTIPKGIVLDRLVFRQSDFIKRSVRNVITVLRDASIIVLIILILFLLDVRATVITLTALPLSIAATLLLLDGFNLSVNVMTLGGLAVAIGELVDDAIIDVENIVRRLRENAALPESARRPRVQVIFDASNEIRASVVFATLLIVVVFIPLLMLEGLEGRFFRPLGIAYIVSILASLLVALTVTPALCRLLLGRKEGSHRGEGFLVRFLKRAYRPSLEWALRHRALVLGASLVVTVASIVLASTFGTSFLPEFNEGSFTVFLMAPPGTSLEESNRVANGIEKRIAAVPGVRSVTRRTGRAERDEHAEPPSSSELDVTLLPGTEKEEVRRKLDAIVANVPGVTTMVGQPIEHRLSHILSGTPASVAINVYGDDLGKLRQLAKEIESELRAIPGARDVAANREVMVTSLPIRFRPQDLATSGMTPASAAEQVQQALHGEVVAEVHQGARRYDIVVRLAAEDRERPDQLDSLLLEGRGGAVVALSDVADLGPERTSNLIARENARRKAVVSCNVAAGYNLGDLIEAVRARVDPIVTNAGYSVEYGGQFEAQQSAGRTILIGGAGVIVLMFVLLHISTRSLKAALVVMFNLPLAIIGGIAAIYFSESHDPVRNFLRLVGIEGGRYAAPVISIASLVGFITLFGIAVRNGILLINHYQTLMKEGHEPTESIVRGSMERLVPILMTALTAALGLIPLALSAGEPGSELLAPLAVVVLGGLLSSTFLNLLVVPAGYSLALRIKTSREKKARA
jgi:CzcA family heavy metal efflux pump